jgi:hypothetical protein|tara:strand:+ start:272 stop:442 length:171 start_codon:yes stop_codon:yes gene_type:complete
LLIFPLYDEVFLVEFVHARDDAYFSKRSPKNMNKYEQETEQEALKTYKKIHILSIL